MKTGGDHIAVCGVNWIGDAIMSMPALSRWRHLHPDASLTMLVKPGVAALWRMHEAPDDVHLLGPGWSGVREAAAALRRKGVDVAYVMPHSPRSALIPFLARVPHRIGLPGLGRSLLLHETRYPSSDPARRHQAYEYLDLVFPGAREALVAPKLHPPEKALRSCCSHLVGLTRPRIGLMPGAARGPSKQWPTERFCLLAQRLANEMDRDVVVMGAPSERPLAERVASAAGSHAVSLAGRTSLEEWAAAIRLCDAVVTNDSGGMHLASALHVPTVALYGITDPSRTGPLGERVRVLQHSHRRTRDVPRDDPEARCALERISLDEVLQALQELGTVPRKESK